MAIPKPKLDLRPGVTEPVVLMISRRQVQEHDLASVLDSLKPFTAAREDAWLYRGQMALVVDGYNDDPRELVDIGEVRAFLSSFYEAWPYWAFFFNQVDDSIKILGSCVCGSAFPGHGVVEMDIEKLGEFMRRGFDGMNTLFDKHGFPEPELEIMSRGFAQYMDYAGSD